MAYELFVLPVPDGADIEEAAEALLARLNLGHERALGSSDAVRRLDEIAQRVLAVDGGGLRLLDEGSAEIRDLRSDDGLHVTVAERHARFRVPFAHAGEEADALFDRLFRLLGAAAAHSGWRVYDPQAACGVAPDDAGRASTLEIYLSAMDQLNPGASQ